MNISDKISLFSAVTSFVTAIITFFAVCIAYRTLHSWKDKERFMQLVKLKRAIFSYRQKVEHITAFKHDNHKINEHLISVLHPALSDVYHEMKLAGFKENESEEFRLFDELFIAQQLYKDSQLDYDALLSCTVKLQGAIKVDFQQI